MIPTVNATIGCLSSNSRSDLSWFVYILITGHVLHSVGGATVYIVGNTIVDDSTDAQNSPVYIGKVQ